MRARGGCGQDHGSALVTTMVVCAVAACAALMTVISLGRSLGVEAMRARQQAVDSVAEQGMADALARLTADPSPGIDALAVHPGLGTGATVDAGPWVRAAADGHVVECSPGDARERCYTVRIVAHPDAIDPTELTVQVSARECRSATVAGGSCVRSRRQATVQRREAVDALLWAGSIDVDAVFGDGSVLEGPIRLGSSTLRTCGAAVVGRTVADMAAGGAEHRMSTTSAVATVQAPGCTAEAAALVSSDIVSTADSVAIPAPDGAALRAAAHSAITDVDGVVDLELHGTFVRHGGGDATVPVTGVVFVDGDVRVSMDASTTLSRPITVAASGDVVIMSDLRVDESTGAMLALVSLDGDLIVVDDGGDRVVEALLVATAAAPSGSAQVQDACTPGPCGSSTFTVRGAMLVRTLASLGAVGPDGSTSSGKVPHLVYDERLRWMQPPFAVWPLRGGWVVRDVIATPPLAPGLS